VLFSSDAQRGSPSVARVDPPLVHAGRPRLPWLLVVVAEPVLMLPACGERGALLPPVLRPVHLDLLLPTLLAAERRVAPAHTQNTQTMKPHRTRHTYEGPRTSDRTCT
jgi:hypothetical protein